ncbi:hypothetical protein XELAEV_18033408mg [Xenopus laevis]|uniref:Uncharacterized protein n=1 Tax=Xenopus laevis TaxID=8355 RepID=A0A974HEE5_XENLA|nr:hypothetical protein XELAEV_18033408mg [Xenopus laevis]
MGGLSIWEPVCIGTLKVMIRSCGLQKLWFSAYEGKKPLQVVSLQLNTRSERHVQAFRCLGAVWLPRHMPRPLEDPRNKPQVCNVRD